MQGKDRKLLFLTQQDITEGIVLKGGETGSKSNYIALQAVFGNENITIIRIPETKSILKRYIHYMGFRNMYSRKQEKVVLEKINQEIWDYIFFDGTWFGKISQMINRKGKIIVFLHNVERQYSLDRFKKNPFTFFKFLSVIFNEKTVIKTADYIFALNERDSQLIHKYYHKKTDILLPVALQDQFEPEDNMQQYEKKTLLFVGSYFRPNVEGIIWFIQEVMPYVDCQLIIVGKNMEKLCKYENDKVTVLGTIERLDKVYQAVHAVVIPIFSGGGMKVKTAEALMYGKEILASDEALTGYEVDDIDWIKCCNSSQEYIEAIKKINIQEKYHSVVRHLFLQKYEQKIKNKQLDYFFQQMV